MEERLTKVDFSNLDKVLFPKLKITKSHVIEYYINVAPRLLDLVANRAIVLTRYPDGVNSQGFYSKDMPKGTPSWVATKTFYSDYAERNILITLPEMNDCVPPSKPKPLPTSSLT